MTTAITSEEVGMWSRLIHDSCGVYLDQAKSYLLTSRLQELLQETKSAGFSDLYYKVKASTSLQSKVVDAITTNETSFFRDSAPFDLLRHKIIPELIDRRAKLGTRPIPVRIWSAACSTGQEVYTIAIVLRELLGSGSGYDIRILGTDISNRVVAAASRGEFSNLEIQRGMPCRVSDEILYEAGRWLEDPRRGSRDGQFPNLEPAATFQFSGPVRHSVLSQCCDLLHRRTSHPAFSEHPEIHGKRWGTDHWQY